MQREIRRLVSRFSQFCHQLHSLLALSLSGVGVSHPIEVREGTVTEGINYEKKGNRSRLVMLPSLYSHTQTCPSYDLGTSIYQPELKKWGEREINV